MIVRKTHLFAPATTQIPNSILDNSHLYKDHEFKVLLALCRIAFGWPHQTISLKNIIETSRLPENQIKIALIGLREIGLINETDSEEFSLTINTVRQ